MYVVVRRVVSRVLVLERSLRSVLARAVETVEQLIPIQARDIGRGFG